MLKSKLDTSCSFGEEHWVVSVVNFGPRVAGHAMIIVEGVVQNDKTNELELFVGQYDIKDGNKSSSSRSSSGTSSSSSTTTSSSSTSSNSSSSTSSRSDSSSSSDNKSSSSSSNKMPSGAAGHISDVRCIEGNKHTRDYESSTSRSFPYVAKKDVLKMIASIKADATRTQRADEGLDTFIPFQLFASDTFYGNKDGGVNCAQWVKEKLEIAGIDHGGSKSKPEKVAGGTICALM